MSTTYILTDDTIPPPSYSGKSWQSPSKERRASRRTRRLFVICSGLFAIPLILLLLIYMFVGPMNGAKCSWSRRSCSWYSLFASDYPVVLISMDGFRHDYLELVKARLGPHSLPQFDRLIANGTRAMKSINAYPTITMPNHHSLVTGLYPEYHGVVGNMFLDSLWPNLRFSMSNQTSLNSDPWLVNWPEPVWVTLQRAGGLAGSLLWPLTDGQVAGDLPFQQVSQFTLVNSAEAQYSYDKRVTDLIWWLNNPRYKLDFVMAYFDEPDETGHAFGPNSSEVATVIQRLDRTLGQLLDGLQQAGLDKSVDIILTADHGMAEVSKSRLIGLDQFVNPDWYNYTQMSTMAFLYPKPGYEAKVYTQLKKAEPQLMVYERHEVPEYLHFNINHSRMPPLVLIPQPGWTIVQNASKSFPEIAGNHGYPMNFTDMLPFFIASGPSFRANQTVPEVHAVDVYPLLCGLLGIPAKPNNGSLSRIESILKPSVADRLRSGSSRFHWLIMHLFTMKVLLIMAGLLGVTALCIGFIILCMGPGNRRPGSASPSLNIMSVDQKP